MIPSVLHLVSYDQENKKDENYLFNDSNWIGEIFENRNLYFYSFQKAKINSYILKFSNLRRAKSKRGRNQSSFSWIFLYFVKYLPKMDKYDYLEVLNWKTIPIIEFRDWIPLHVFQLFLKIKAFYTIMISSTFDNEIEETIPWPCFRLH